MPSSNKRRGEHACSAAMAVKAMAHLYGRAPAPGGRRCRSRGGGFALGHTFVPTATRNGSRAVRAKYTDGDDDADGARRASSVVRMRCYVYICSDISAHSVLTARAARPLRRSARRAVRGLCQRVARHVLRSQTRRTERVRARARTLSQFSPSSTLTSLRTHCSSSERSARISLASRACKRLGLTGARAYSLDAVFARFSVGRCTCCSASCE